MHVVILVNFATCGSMQGLTSSLASAPQDRLTLISRTDTCTNICLSQNIGTPIKILLYKYMCLSFFLFFQLFNWVQENLSSVQVNNTVLIYQSVCFLSIFLGRVVVSFPQKVINLPRTYQKLHCKGEPFQFSGQHDPAVQIDRQIHRDPVILLYTSGFAPSLGALH